jgi:hypothetical protein
MPLASLRVEVEEFNWPEPVVDEFDRPVPVVGEVTWPDPVVDEFNWLPWVLRMPELVGELVEPAADVPALPGMVLLLAALLPVVTLAPPVAPATAAPLDPPLEAPAEPPAAAPPPAPAASAMLLPPRIAMVASKAMQCLVCGICLLL